MELIRAAWCVSQLVGVSLKVVPEKNSHKIQIGGARGLHVLVFLRQQLANLEFVAVTTQIFIHTGQQSYVRNTQLLHPDGPAGVVLEDV
ncbi:Uncharacterized protein FKW44_000662 [Caligus rogercresseyi]|uniref:Uncharacterized protein n=1 Tax=Caligus rogercresseyi TaxID=217165 RepID=A0A7T8QV05_CALRO|nr:Uncharacterized protein FKW44_000662 [Caligus rogercresseyi]